MAAAHPSPGRWAFELSRAAQRVARVALRQPLSRAWGRLSRIGGALEKHLNVRSFSDLSVLSMFFDFRDRQPNPWDGLLWRCQRSHCCVFGPAPAPGSYVVVEFLQPVCLGSRCGESGPQQGALVSPTSGQWKAIWQSLPGWLRPLDYQIVLSSRFSQVVFNPKALKQGVILDAGVPLSRY